MIWDDTKIVPADLETSGHLPEYALQPWRLQRGDMWITSASFLRSTPGVGFTPILSQLFPTKGQILSVLEHVLFNDLTVLGWNIAFDISVLMALGPDVEDLCMRIKWLDGMLIWRHYDIEPEYEFSTAKHKKKSYSLKGYLENDGTLKPGAMQEWLPHVPLHNKDVDFHATDPVSLERLQAYNDQDNVYTFTIARMIWHKLTPAQRQAVIVEAEALPLVAQANLDGLVVDQLACHHLGAKLVDDAAGFLAKLAPDGMTEEIVRSPTKLGELMFDRWGLPVLKENKSKVEGKPNSRSTDKEVLHELAFIDPRAKLIKQYRETLNARGKFNESVTESVAYNDDGRTHPIARIFSTYTGRMTMSSKQGRGSSAVPIGFALHQMKREAEFREFITVPEGYDLVEFDAAGQEFRWMAIASGDQTMLDLCCDGQDAHTFMGAQIVGMSYEDLLAKVKAKDATAGQNRYLGKFANLCIKAHTPILTNRGACNIEDVRDDDLVWDGVEFVAHDGVRFSGMFPVTLHDGVSGTLAHEVMVDGQWATLETAAASGWQIDRARSRGAGFRIVGGIARRYAADRARAARYRALRLWHGFVGHLEQFGVRAVYSMPKLCDTRVAPDARQSGAPRRCDGADMQARGSNGSAVPQPERSVVAQLWRTWDQIRLCLGKGSSIVHTGAPAAPNVSPDGCRPGEQRRPLRTWKLALGIALRQFAEHAPFAAGRRELHVGAHSIPLYGADHAEDAAVGVDPRADRRTGPKGGSREAEELAHDRGKLVATYDIVNCGPRTRFAANGRIVHNSLQYRTSARKLRSKARVDYDIPLEMPEAHRIHATYQRAYPGVPAYWARQIAMVKGLGYVETFGGNRITVKGDWNGTWGWSMGSTAINARIQGTGADQKHLAVAYIKPYLRQTGTRFMFDLHDGLYLAVPSGIRPMVVNELKRMLDNLPYQEAWGFTPPIPMPWDCKVGKAWGRMKEEKFK